MHLPLFDHSKATILKRALSARNVCSACSLKLSFYCLLQVHLHKKLAAIEECGAQPEAVGGEDEGPYARAVLSQLRNTHHVRDVVRQWCFLDGRGNRCVNCALYRIFFTFFRLSSLLVVD